MIGTGVALGALLLSGTIGWTSHTEVASAAAAKAPTVDQMIAKVTAASTTLKNFHLNATKKLDIQAGGIRVNNINKLSLDVNRLPNFAAVGKINISLLEKSYDLYANAKEFYILMDGSELIAASQDDAVANEDDSEVSPPVVEESGEEQLDPNSQYWVETEKKEWESFYSKSQYDPASMLNSVKNYKKLMKVNNVGKQTVLQFTTTDPKAAKAIIELYDQENLWDGETLQPKSVTWKLFVNTKTWQTEKLTVDLNYSLVLEEEKDIYTTKIEATYSKYNKIATIVRPAELE